MRALYFLAVLIVFSAVGNTLVIDAGNAFLPVNLVLTFIAVAIPLTVILFFTTLIFRRRNALAHQPTPTLYYYVAVVVGLITGYVIGLSGLDIVTEYVNAVSIIPALLFELLWDLENLISF